MTVEGISEPPGLPWLIELPLVLYRMIIEQLFQQDLESFCALRLASRACRNQSEVFFFRTLTLHDRSSTDGITPYMVKRLQDPEDALPLHVRHLRIGPFAAQENCPSAEAIVKALRTLNNLQSFSWNVWFPIPACVLHSFHVYWPSAKLRVKNIARNLMQIDKALLSASQLYSLEYTVLCNSSSGHSEMRSLKQCLIQAGNLKVLDLRVNDVWSEAVKQEISQWPDVQEGPLNFDFQASESFPALEELRLEYDGYELALAHCQRWKNVMKWSQLKTLDLGRGVPEYLLATLSGEVPNLTTLRFGFWPSRQYRRPRTWDCDEPDVVKKFLNSIKGLKEVCMAHYGWKPLDEIWPGFIAQHGPSLRHLKISYEKADERHYNTATWSADDLVAFGQDSPDIESLEVKLALENGAWPKSTTKALTQFRTLRRVSFRIVIGKHCSSFCTTQDDKRYYLNAQAALRATITLFEEWVQGDPSADIERVKLIFMSGYPGIEWPFEVKRVGKSGAWVIAKGSTAVREGEVEFFLGPRYYAQ